MKLTQWLSTNQNFVRARTYRPISRQIDRKIIALLHRFYSWIRFRHESIFTEIFLKLIKGKLRGKDCFRPCGLGLTLCLLRGSVNTGIIVRFSTVILIIMPQGALHVREKSWEMVSAVISTCFCCDFMWFHVFLLWLSRGSRLAEGEQVLTGGVLNKQKSQDDIITEFGDSASFTLSLLGHIYW